MKWTATRPGTIATLGGIALALIVAVVWLRSAPPVSSQGEIGGVAAAASPPLEWRGVAAPPQARADAASAPIVDAPAAAAQPLSRDELIALLREIASTIDGGDPKAVERALERLLGQPENLRALVDWLASQREDSADDPVAARGALIALEAALAVYNDPQGKFAAEGEPLTRHLLDSLPRMSEALRAPLIELLARARSRGHAVLDARFLSQLLELRRRFPNVAESMGALLAPIAESLDTPELREEFRRLFLSDVDDPAAVKVALSALLQEAPETFLSFAEELARRDELSAELRAAVAQAIATSAPVEAAVPVMARLASDSFYPQFLTLATRAGASEAVTREYNALLASEGNARGRKLLVSAMESESEAVMLGIARTDPDPNVRAQALMTLTVARAVGPDVIDELASLQAARIRDTPGLSLANGIAVAHNVLLKSTDAARDRARDYLIAIVRDAALGDRDRQLALAQLKGWVAPGTFQGVQIGGRAVE